MPRTDDDPEVIVAAGPARLSTAIAAASHGARVLLVDVP